MANPNTLVVSSNIQLMHDALAEAGLGGAEAIASSASGLTRDWSL